MLNLLFQGFFFKIYLRFNYFFWFLYLIFTLHCRILDNLPVAVLRQRRDGVQSTTYEHGFRVGFKGNYAGVSLIQKNNNFTTCLIRISILPWIFNLSFTYRAKRKNILSIIIWALESCFTRILRLILLELLGLKLLQTGICILFLIYAWPL